MWLKKSLLIINLLFIIVQVVHCGPVKLNETLSSENEPTTSEPTFESITFNRTNTVCINGIDFNELNCIAKSSLDRIACVNITQVTCEEVSIGEVRSCSVSNEDSVFMNSSVSNEGLVCADANQTKGNCYLSFSLDSESSLETTGYLENDDQFENDPDATMAMVIFFVLLFLFICTPVLCCCFVVVNNYCFDGRCSLERCLGMRGNNNNDEYTWIAPRRIAQSPEDVNIVQTYQNNPNIGTTNYQNPNIQPIYYPNNPNIRPIYYQNNPIIRTTYS